MADTPATRPLSPHLQIFKPLLNMVLSITHRITGAALYFGMLLLVWWLLALSAGEAAFQRAQNFFGHPVGQLVLLGFAWALVQHMLSGIRHLVWDTGHWLALEEVAWTSRAILGLSVVLTALLWIAGYLAW